MPSLRDRFQRWPGPWRRAVVAVLALYALYLLAGNLYLNTPLFDASTNRQPHTFTMQTGPALTLFPGEVIAFNVRMRGQANRTVYVSMPTARMHVLLCWPCFGAKSVCLGCTPPG
ncbi:hypothetical protein DXO246_13540 [Xanthomonas oryzae pv. oryzae]|uniref:Uncharacterized protein n=2 Tax=Xanthomonas oryzae pv. oryzae TaxID=64187 RepID=A0A0K0GG60_XANOP|nr:hypothetical protein PXO_03697 [Xanthomonas oryzae pv. oryzae PXO99A]AOS13523.1 hypothetical protein ATY45_02255 [Xanthomonas oryzae pv. oryzae]UEQ20269.1 hypothetical protein KFK26_02435 [Xanthomonas oryzae]AOS33243.1 hypothetical protein ATY49_20970 [Xanthomonas oryzae pv. oryzae]AXM38749.1 hypothetical protein BRN51_02545 [Xanthomonas oryzae pv. oryzae]